MKVPKTATESSRCRRHTVLRPKIRRIGRSLLASALCAAMTLSPFGAALAAQSAEPGESFTFSDATPAAQAAGDRTSRTAAAPSRRVPVSSSGSFATSVTVDVPPGRRGMTPSLSLSYDSGRAQTESVVGLGFSLSSRSITRSTRKGFPKVAANEDFSSFAFDEALALFSAPAGELTLAPQDARGPDAPGTLYLALRESSPVRYMRVAKAPPWAPPRGFGGVISGTARLPNLGAFFTGGYRWEEHDPSGATRYYGEDPFTGKAAKVVTGPGEFEWLLLREEDAFGNAITYEYHHIEDQNREARAEAQRAPVLKKVTWGQNRLTGVPAQFIVETVLAPQAGPLNMLSGHTLLTAKISEIRVGTSSGTRYWTYRLNYETSPSSQRQRLKSVERVDASSEAPTYRKTRFRYQDGGPRFDAGWQALTSHFDPMAYVQGQYRDNVAPARVSASGAANAVGYGSGTKFLDYDGDGALDALYHGAGLAIPQASIVSQQSHITCARGGPCPEPIKSRVSDLADMDGDGDVDPLTFPEQIYLCAPPDALYNWADPKNAIFGIPKRTELFENTTRDSGVSLPTRDFLPKWPDSAYRTASLTIRDVSNPAASGPPHYVYAAQVGRDMKASVTDVNADGRPDVALLKSFAFKGIPDGGDKVHCLPAGDLVTRNQLGSGGIGSGIPGEGWPSGGGRENPEAPMELGPLIFNGRGFQLPHKDSEASGRQDPQDRFSETYQFTPRFYVASGDQKLSYAIETSGFSRSVQYATNTVAEHLDAIDVPDLTESPSGTHPNQRPGQLPTYLPQADFNSLLLDVNGDSLPDLVLAEPPVTKRRPLRGYEEDYDNSGMRTEYDCFGGHRVLINRGYRFEWRSPYDREPSQYTDSPFADENWSEPLSIIKNRGRWCSAPGKTKFSDIGLSAAAPYMPWGVPMSAVSPTDINGDGRLDIIIAYHFTEKEDAKGIPLPGASDPTGDTATVHRVLFNTGRGFVLGDPHILPDDFGLVHITQVGTARENPIQPGAANLRLQSNDVGRLVDIDSDGLVDLVKPGIGHCERGRCTVQKAARWTRNTGSRPDLLTSVESSTGTYTHVKYEPVLASNRVTFSDARGIRPPASMRVATRIETGTHEKGTALPGAAPPQVVTLAYDNFVRDPVSREQLGFETVVARFENSFGGKPTEPVSEDARNAFGLRLPSSITQQLADIFRETVTVTQTFDVQAVVPGIALRHPLKGRLIQTETSSTDVEDVQITRHHFDLAPQGVGVRIRPAATFTEHCVGDQGCRTTGTETLEFDELGFATAAIRGEADEAGVLESGSLTTQTMFEHQQESWILGMPALETTWGESVDLQGQRDPDAVLAQTERLFTDNGLVKEEWRPEFQAPGCEPTGVTDKKTHQYTAEGLPESTTHVASGRVEITRYGGDQLYPASNSASVTRYVDGVRQGQTLLESRYSFNPRTGQQTSVTDPNGVTTLTSYDSLGRSIATSVQPGPGADFTTLTESTYGDDTTPTVDTKTYRRAGTFTVTRTHLDGAGNALGVVEQADGLSIRTAFTAYDAFGRAVLSALPGTVRSLDAFGIAWGDPFVETVTDGFDRSESLIKPDGTETMYAYGPTWAEETNARGHVTHRELDWQGNIVRVDRYGETDTLIATHSIERDGLGRIASITDADGTVRRYERDRGGRLVVAPVSTGHLE